MHLCSFQMHVLLTRPIQHPGYDSGPGDPNIGLIRLALPAPLDGTYVDTILPAPADVGDLIGANCVITGWGLTHKGTG